MCLISQQIRGIAEKTNTPRIQGSATVAAAIEIMEMYEADLVAVLCESTFVGVFSNWEFTRNVVRQNLEPEDTTLYEVIVLNPPFVGPEVSLKDTYETMIAYQWNYMPVLDDHQLYGIVRLNDLSSDLMKSYEEARAENDMIMHYIQSGESYAMADYEHRVKDQSE